MAGRRSRDAVPGAGIEAILSPSRSSDRMPSCGAGGRRCRRPRPRPARPRGPGAAARPGCALGSSLRATHRSLPAPAPQPRRPRSSGCGRPSGEARHPSLAHQPPNALANGPLVVVRARMRCVHGGSQRAYGTERYVRADHFAEHGSPSASTGLVRGETIRETGDGVAPSPLVDPPGDPVVPPFVPRRPSPGAGDASRGGRHRRRFAVRDAGSRRMRRGEGALLGRRTSRPARGRLRRPAVRGIRPDAPMSSWTSGRTQACSAWWRAP